MIVIIDYDMGNIGSIMNMIKKAGGNAVCSSDTNVIKNAEKLILPGVGAFDKGMNNLKELGIIELLDKKVIEEKTPVLGICLGMQLMTKKSEEGELNGLGWINAETKRFVFNDKSLKIPHMGWDNITIQKQDMIFEETEENQRFYFVHSYYVDCYETNDILCKTNYGREFVSGFRKNNIFGFQFHPEKSHKYGLKLIKNFIMV